MATAEELLAGEVAPNEVSDHSNFLVIDNDLRTITIPDEIKILGVESDDDVQRLHFKMPKMYGEFDLSEFELRVNYMNAGNEPDLYEVKDAAVSGDVIEFSWLVGRTAVKFKGDVKFIVCAKLIKADGVVEKEFNTAVASLPVLEGLETNEAIVQKNPDILENILKRLDDLEQTGGTGGGSGDGGGGVYFETDETLTLKNGILSVNTADVVEEDNTLPVTSAAVYAEVGNINALLATI